MSGGAWSLAMIVHSTRPQIPPMPQGIVTLPRTSAAPPMPIAALGESARTGHSPRRYSTSSCALKAGRPMIPLCAAVSASDRPGSTWRQIKVGRLIGWLLTVAASLPSRAKRK